MDDTLHRDGSHPAYEVITLRGAHGAALWRWWLRGRVQGDDLARVASTTVALTSAAVSHATEQV